MLVLNMSDANFKQRWRAGQAAPFAGGCNPAMAKIGGAVGGGSNFRVFPKCFVSPLQSCCNFKSDLLGLIENSISGQGVLAQRIPWPSRKYLWPKILLMLSSSSVFLLFCC